MGNIPHSGIPGPPSGPACCSTSTDSLLTGSDRIVDSRRQIVVVAKHDGRSRVHEKIRIGRGLLDDRAPGREIAAQDRYAPFMR